MTPLASRTAPRKPPVNVCAEAVLTRAIVTATAPSILQTCTNVGLLILAPPNQPARRKGGACQMTNNTRVKHLKFGAVYGRA